MSERFKKNRGSAGNNRKAGEDFLIKNRQKTGIVETDSGLQYQIVTEGEGASPSDSSTVTVHQRALLIDGKLIEDTYRTNEPSTVAMGELIDGYKEGLKLMKEGGRYKFFISPELGWGAKGTGSKIPPFAVLVFDVKLLKVQ